jgi:hypothetical protein
VDDLVDVLVRGGGPTEFPQAFGHAAGTDGADGVQGGGADRDGPVGSLMAIVSRSALTPLDLRHTRRERLVQLPGRHHSH